MPRSPPKKFLLLHNKSTRDLMTLYVLYVNLTAFILLRLTNVRLLNFIDKLEASRFYWQYPRLTGIFSRAAKYILRVKNVLEVLMGVVRKICSASCIIDRRVGWRWTFCLQILTSVLHPRFLPCTWLRGNERDRAQWQCFIRAQVARQEFEMILAWAGQRPGEWPA